MSLSVSSFFSEGVVCVSTLSLSDEFVVASVTGFVVALFAKDGLTSFESDEVVGTFELGSDGAIGDGVSCSEVVSEGVVDTAGTSVSLDGTVVDSEFGATTAGTSVSLDGTVEGSEFGATTAGMSVDAGDVVSANVN